MTNEIIRKESTIELFGLPARAFNVVADTETGRILNQAIVTGKEFAEEGTRYRLTVKLRFDDNCRNGHESFAITADLDEKRGGLFREHSGGCLHDEIAAHFPQLAHLIKWRLTSTDGPTHYIANTVYQAGDRDHWGARKGEPHQWETGIKFVGVPFTHRKSAAFTEWLKAARNITTASDTNPNHPSFIVSAVQHKDDGKPGSYKFGPKYTFEGFACEWHNCPFDTQQEAEEFAEALRLFAVEFPRTPTAWGEGKERDLEAARRAAVWPDATDEELMQEREQLKVALTARLPALLENFKADMLACGFLWPEKVEG